MAIRTSIPSRPFTSLLFLAFVLGFTFFAPSPSLSPSSSSILPHLLQVVGQTTTVGGSVDHPNTPADGASAVQHECLLDEIAFTGGLKIQGSFQSNKFHYQLQCDEVQFPSPRVTIVRPHTVDYGSSAEVTFNDEHINFRTMKNAISNGGDNNQAPNSPLFESYPLTFRSGANTITVGVGCNMRALPNPCYYQYHFECKPKGNGTSIIGDPQFIGLRGQNYQVHGVSGEVYNIVSDADLQYNSRFVFLTEGSCPVVNGKRQKGCFSHSGSYLGELGLKTRSGDKIHLVSGTAKAGFETIQVNSKDLQVGDTIFLADNLGSVSRNSTHMASVTVGSWNFVFENSDMFINQHVYVAKEVMVNLRSHGLLGQTWSDATYPNPIKYIQGYVDDYVIRENDVFGDNFVYNHFN